MARGLSTAQRTAIRRVHDEGASAALSIPAVTFRSLVRSRLVGVDAAGCYLTTTGEREYTRIMESGDGPEDLKARLNAAFGGGSRW
jgi:hypothetical protein